MNKAAVPFINDNFRSVASFLKVKQAEDKQFIVVIDEFPYIVNSNKAIPSMLQNLVEHYLKNTKLFFIICSSSMSFFEKGVLTYKSPLYGRRTAELKLNHSTFMIVQNFLKITVQKKKLKLMQYWGG